MSKMVFVLEKLVKNRNFKCKVEWLEQPEYKIYEELRKQKLCTRKKEIVGAETWYIYSVNNKAEKLYQKMKR